MQAKPQTNPGSLDLVMGRLMQFSEKGVAVANRNKQQVRNFALLGVLSALWVSYYFQQQFALSTITTTTMLVVLLVPGLALGRTYFALREIGDLPRRVEQYLGTVKNSVTDYKDRVQSNLSSRAAKFRLSEVLSIGKELREVVSVARDSAELSSLFGGALLLGNPMFLLFLLFASGISALIFLAAVVTFVAYVL